MGRYHYYRLHPFSLPEVIETQVGGDLNSRQALDRLSEDHRQVIVLRYYADLSEAAISDALGVPPGTVKSRTARALSHLRTLLEGDDD